VSTSDGLPVSGIVLAGGRSARFGRDKLVEPVGGLPLVHHAILALGTVCREVIVVVGVSGGDMSAPTGLAVPFRVVRDAHAFEGPLVGLLAGLDAAREPLVLAVGGDMPALQSAILDLIVGRLARDESADAAVLEHRGRLRPLPLAVRVGATGSIGRRQVERGDRSLIGLLNSLRTAVIDERAWRPFDPEGASLRDVDIPSDLDLAGG
jgi:molybdopterin-guanine dinucleotide biosynthesis protein A